MEKKFYITTPIYYPNAKPHIGTIYSTVLADIIARYYRLFGNEVVFLTGTDEHGQKIFDAAKKVNKDPQLFVDEIAENFQSIFPKWHISNTIFMRTTADFHKRTVQKWIEKLQEKELVYQSTYQGWYSLSQENFLLEKDIEKKSPAGIPICPISGQEAIWLQQEAYFFKLSFFEKQLLDFFTKNPYFITPKEKLEEIISFVKSGLKDLCISRSKKDLSWGIPFPNDPEHVVYVWADALNNYITAIGYLQDEDTFNSIWPCDLHLMAKDISRFHAVYWPAFLLAVDLPLPKKELVHGWLLVDNQKMSKSLRNIIDPELLLEKYNADTVRYYLASLSIAQDATFSYADLEQKHNSDLCDTLSNLFQRALILSQKKGLSSVKANELNETDKELYLFSLQLADEIKKELETNYFIAKVIQGIMLYLNKLNAYFHAEQPWKLKDEKRFEQIMSVIFHGIRQIGIFLLPIMPVKMGELLNKLSIDENTITFSDAKNIWNIDFLLPKNSDYLFTKYQEKKEIDLINNAIKQEKLPSQKSFPIITFDEFLKTVILVGKIITVEDIPQSEKLYLMTVDFGEYGIKKIAGGIKQFYSKDQLINKKTIFSYNLAPRKLCGIESEGMTLMAKNKDNKPELIEILDTVSQGTRIG